MSKECREARNVVLITMLVLAIIVIVVNIWVVG